jgi:hypothetical protein
VKPLKQLPHVLQVLALGFPLRKIVLALLQHLADGRELLVGERHLHQCTTAFGS